MATTELQVIVNAPDDESLEALIREEAAASGSSTPSDEEHLSFILRPISAIHTKFALGDNLHVSNSLPHEKLASLVSNKRLNLFVCPFFGGSVRDHYRVIDEYQQNTKIIEMMLSGADGICRFHVNVSGNIFFAFTTVKQIIDVADKIAAHLTNIGQGWKSSLQEAYTPEKSQLSITGTNDHIRQYLEDFHKKYDPRFFDRIVHHLLSLCTGTAQNYQFIQPRAPGNEANFSVMYLSEEMTKFVLFKMVQNAVLFRLPPECGLYPIRQIYSHFRITNAKRERLGYQLHLAGIKRQSTRMLKTVHIQGDQQLRERAWSPNDVLSQVTMPMRNFTSTQLAISEGGTVNKEYGNGLPQYHITTRGDSEVHPAHFESTSLAEVLSCIDATLTGSAVPAFD